MIDLSRIIQTQFNNVHGLNLDPLEVVNTQKSLIKNKIIPVPNSFLDFLEMFNGINYNGGEIFGIEPPSNIVGDILDINLKQERLPKSNYIILGVDDMDYLVYNQEKEKYQIIDKLDLEVVEEYAELQRAISYILKV